MRTRTHMVSNSSSSSYVVINSKHPAFLFLKAMEFSPNSNYIIMHDDSEVEDIQDNGTFSMLLKYNEIVGHDYDIHEFLRQTDFSG